MNNIFGRRKIQDYNERNFERKNQDESEWYFKRKYFFFSLKCEGIF